MAEAFLYTFENLGISIEYNYCNVKFKNYIAFYPKHNGVCRTGIWKNSKEQREIILTHDINDVLIITNNISLNSNEGGEKDGCKG